MSVMTVWTAFSKYEIDQAGKRVRRMVGVNAPTDRQGDDGQWRQYHHVEFLAGGLLIHWDDAGHCTHTSDIVSVHDDASAR